MIKRITMQEYNTLKLLYDIRILKANDYEALAFLYKTHKQASNSKSM